MTIRISITSSQRGKPVQAPGLAGMFGATTETDKQVDEVVIEGEEYTISDRKFLETATAQASVAFTQTFLAEAEAIVYVDEPADAPATDVHPDQTPKTEDEGGY